VSRFLDLQESTANSSGNFWTEDIHIIKLEKSKVQVDRKTCIISI